MTSYTQPNNTSSLSIALSLLKLDRLIVLNATPPQPEQFPLPWQPTLFQTLQPNFKILVIPSMEDIKQGHELRLTHLKCLLDHADDAPLAINSTECFKWSEKPFISLRSGTQYVAMVIKIVRSYCRAPLVEPYCKKSNISDQN